MSIRLTETDLSSLLGISKPQRKHKYGAKATEYNGMKYPSKAQAERAAQLDALQAAGKVAWYLKEVPIFIGEQGVDKPYRVDFLVAELVAQCHCRTLGQPMRHIEIRAEDVKGFQTATFKRHVRQWRLKGPFPLWVIRGKDVEIITKEPSHGSEID